MDHRDRDFLVLSGLAIGLSWLCYFRALQLGPDSKVAPVDKLSLVLVVIAAAIFLGERILVGTGIWRSDGGRRGPHSGDELKRIGKG